MNQNNISYLPLSSDNPYLINNNCVFCNRESKKYKCPNCLKYICSVECSKSHKINCKKKEIEYKPISKMTVKDLNKDLLYLSNIISKSNKVKKKLNVIDSTYRKQEELMRFKILKINCKKRGINLISAPIILERHRENISFYFSKDKVLYWNIDLKFIFNLNINPNVVNDNLDLLSKNISHSICDPICEDLFLKELFKNDSIINIIYKNNELLSVITNISNFNSNNFEIYVKNTLIKDRLFNYNFDNFGINQESIDYYKNNLDSKYIKLNKDFKLRDVLICMNIIEFPTLYFIKVN